MYKKIDKSIIVLVFIFMIISVITIYSAEKIVDSSNYYFIKQLVWYLIGFIIAFYISNINLDRVYEKAYVFYLISNILLLLLLIFGSPINESKCWFKISGIGTIQPSEFVKIALIILLANECCNFKKKYINPKWKDELKFLLKIILLILPPSILTFLEPDTGVVLIYFVITISILFISGIRYRWFILLVVLISMILGFILTTYFFNKSLFINIFGNSFFLRINRLLDWSNKSGYQLTNSLISIGSSGIFGRLFNNNLYIPEAQTDFIFAVLASSFGIIGSLLIIILIVIFDIKIINIGLHTKKIADKLAISGIVGMLTYQQFQNISMTIGLMPITGITLPFISYGGSSLLSYMIILGLILNISRN